uniref:Uncharacterized protein n=1 Tax=Rhizophora mucronata TaxID=61149 RepID=A0A2P2Q245_RHIMU
MHVHVLLLIFLLKFWLEYTMMTRTELYFYGYYCVIVIGVCRGM